MKLYILYILLAIVMLFLVVLFSQRVFNGHSPNSCLSIRKAEITKMLQKQKSESPQFIILGYIPQCNIFGNYASVQRMPGSGYAWCVDKFGEKNFETSFAPSEPYQRVLRACKTSRIVDFFNHIVNIIDTEIRIRF